MKSWQAEGLSLDDKYEIEEYATMMKSFADAATQGDLEQVITTSNIIVVASLGRFYFGIVCVFVNFDRLGQFVGPYNIEYFYT